MEIGSKIQMIKMVRAVSAMGLKEAKDWVESHTYNDFLIFISERMIMSPDSYALQSEVHQLRAQNEMLRNQLRSTLDRLPRELLIAIIMK